ncbi:hypothetical protein EST38_g8539 [Candolleomyces aberdarensis]|uniref:Nephrocystin 3-like N-terminal domain-containing protein n=1 Tax=Candolleomyces aberdarensis TaxID=2316362 RepID=A0A4Q2DC70_9AGAR|nr:hypothetical protein EST38_g8539 [Candolleomyces aberdarensis]
MAKKSQKEQTPPNPANASSSSTPAKQTTPAKSGKSSYPTKISTNSGDTKKKGANKAAQESSTDARAANSDRRAGAPSASTNRPAADLNFALQQLRSRNVIGATYNSLDTGAQRCHDGTRVADQDNLVNWIKQASTSKDSPRIQWVTGSPGSGKTTVLRSVAHRCQSEGLLAGSFIFSSVSPYANERKKTHLFASLAYQFVVNDDMRDLKGLILSTVQRNPGVFESALDAQLEELLLRPLRQVPSERKSRWPKAIIIDNLDECMAPPPQGFKGKRRTNSSEQQEVLNALLRALRDTAFPFRLVIGTRDDQPFHLFFTRTARGLASTFRLNEKPSEAGVEPFLKAKFNQIRQRHHFDQSWPHSTLLPKLTTSSHGRFIYPFTLIRYLESSTWNSPKQDPLNQLSSSNSVANPAKNLDELYSLALGSDSSDSSNATQFVRWIWTTHLIQTGHFGEPVSEHLTAAFLHQFLGPVTNSDTLIGTFMDSSSPIRIYHRSLLDFLGDRTRCGPFKLYVQEPSRFSFIATRYVEVCKNKGAPKGSSMDQGAFLRIFLTLQPSFHLLTKEDYRSLEQSLLACDAECVVGLVAVLRVEDGGLRFYSAVGT